jgi:hypothetical protein
MAKGRPLLRCIVPGRRFHRYQVPSLRMTMKAR